MKKEAKNQSAKDKKKRKTKKEDLIYLQVPASTDAAVAVCIELIDQKVSFSVIHRKSTSSFRAYKVFVIDRIHEEAISMAKVVLNELSMPYRIIDDGKRDLSDIVAIYPRGNKGKAKEVPARVPEVLETVPPEDPEGQEPEDLEGKPA